MVFLENYAEMHAILLPGRIPGVKDYGKAKLLPSSVSRRMVYKTYADACGGRIACLEEVCASHLQHQAHDGLMLDL